MNEEEQNAIWHVLTALLTEGEEWTQQSKERIDTASSIEPFNRWRLHSYRHSPSGEFKPGEGIIVKPPCKEVSMAALWCKWERGSGFRFYLGMWLCSGWFVASRFEPPERGSNHGYYHSQPCRTMGWEGKPEYKALAVPERNPTWPLPAGSSLELLLCLVVSIRGMDGLRNFRKERIEGDPKIRGNRTLSKALDEIANLQTMPT